MSETKKLFEINCRSCEIKLKNSKEDRFTNSINVSHITKLICGTTDDVRLVILFDKNKFKNSIDLIFENMNDRNNCCEIWL